MFMAQNAGSNLPMQDRELIEDALHSQKQITESYNTCANECATPTIRDELLNLLREEHTIQASVFSEMQKRGWYPTPMAEEQKIQSAKQKYTAQTP